MSVTMPSARFNKAAAYYKENDKVSRDTEKKHTHTNKLYIIRKECESET